MGRDFIDFVRTASTESITKAINLLIEETPNEEIEELISKLKKLI
jgi:hypothetical protein